MLCSTTGTPHNCRNLAKPATSPLVLLNVEVLDGIDSDVKVVMFLQQHQLKALVKHVMHLRRWS